MRCRECAASFAQLEGAVGVEVKSRPGGLQLADPGRTFLDEDLYRLGVAQRCAGGERIPSVEFRRVAGAQRGGDPALRVGSGGVEKGSLGDHSHRTMP
jgi:hypothetical protein